MISVTTGIPVMNRWNLTYFDTREFNLDERSIITSLSDLEFGFLEDGDRYQESYTSSSAHDDTSNENAIIEEEDEEKEESNHDIGSVEESNNFWENQHQLLQATLSRSSSFESRIRKATKELLKKKQLQGDLCGCGRGPVTVSSGCKNCLMREVSCHLRNEGYNSAICKSKWKSSSYIPSGEHTFLDAVDKSSSKRAGEVRVIIELNFRAEFQMARASEEYNRLVDRLPELFVGKVERLDNVIKILCSAAKKCMKEKKMHMGPWRKHRYMKAKWLGTCERTTSTPLLSMGHSS
ncbi:DUF506 domain-containing protein [Cephalotus follicularis]|uniref:DUF506 domain-containing protein n=1 Tax=Cephalotus follicularis TaxID=3775 RepID=A0A1Q3BII6_CEPFO|nr:DUF506 domain-containing protein [Cephalotus follicularis]